MTEQNQAACGARMSAPRGRSPSGGPIPCAAICASLRQAWASVNEVAERYGLKPNHLSSWRTMARQGKLLLPAPEDAVEFADMVVRPPAVEPPIRNISRPEIIVGSVTIRLEEGESAARIVAVARSFAASAWQD